MSPSPYQSGSSQDHDGAKVRSKRRRYLPLNGRPAAVPRTKARVGIKRQEDRLPGRGNRRTKDAA